jgi:hypothetical protein
MKYLLMTLAVVVIFAGQALATDGNLSNDMLAKMGLSGMSVMSDAQGAAVRGMGYAAVYGTSYANLYGSGSVNGYSAVSNTGSNPYIAGGIAVSGVGNSSGRFVVAGGFSVAVAKK